MTQHINIDPWLTGAAVAAAVYGIALVVYRLCFHPLAKFPGPKWAASTKWWEFYYDNLKGQGGTYSFEIEKMHEQYGACGLHVASA